MEWNEARRRPTEVEARGPISENEKHKVNGSVLEAEVGYFLVNYGDSIYPVKPSIFYKTYQNPIKVVRSTGWTKLKKKQITINFRGPIESKVVVSTVEGDVIAEEGDYIVKGVEGEKYPIKPEVFTSLYEEI